MLGAQTPAAPTSTSGADQTTREKTQELFERFSKNNPHVSIWGKVQRLCYWESGQYRLTMRVETAKPERRFERVWRFAVSEVDASLLRANFLAITQEACGQLQREYNFAYARYEPPEKPR